MFKATWGAGGKAVQQARSLSGKKELLKSTTDKTQNTNDNNNQNESTHNNLQDIRNKIADSRSAMSNYMF